jgi:hypothetical protein
MIEETILVDIIGDCVSQMRVKGISSDTSSNINYDAGSFIQIIDKLNTFDESITLKSKKYPLVALRTRMREKRGLGFYAKTIIDKIVISTISNDTDDVLQRYSVNGTFKKILYPCYYEFMFRLAQSPKIIGSDPDAFIHIKMDSPGVQPLTLGGTDFIDSIEIIGLEIILNQIKNCN